MASDFESIRFEPVVQLDRGGLNVRLAMRTRPQLDQGIGFFRPGS